MREYRCPLNVVLTTFDDDHAWSARTELCEMPLHLVWYLDWPINDEHHGPLQREDAAKFAYTDSWRVQCENGHVIAESGCGTADDYAEPFDLNFVMRAIGALR